MVRLLSYSLILMGALMIVAEANNMVSSAHLQPPASSPSNNAIKQETPKAHRIRKLGKHHSKAISSAVSPSLSPSEAPVTKENTNHVEKQSSLYQEGVSGQSQDIRVTTPRHHHSFDRSVAGGGVILGGLATTFLVAVICYIRATRRTIAEKAAEPATADPV